MEGPGTNIFKTAWNNYFFITTICTGGKAITHYQLMLIDLRIRLGESLQ